jgi:hypothetical protein
MHLVIVYSTEEDGPRLTAEINGTLLSHSDARNRVSSSSKTGLIHLIHASGSAALGPYYQAADVFVTNPVCEFLQTSFLEEAMANALPLLAPLCEGSLEILKDGATALLHKDPLDVSGLAANLIALDTRTASGALKAQDMGRAGCGALREKGALDKNRFAHRFFDLLRANLGKRDLQSAQKPRQSGAFDNNSLFTDRHRETGPRPGLFAESPDLILNRGGLLEWHKLSLQHPTIFEAPSIQIGDLIYIWGGYDHSLETLQVSMDHLLTLDVSVDPPKWQDLGPLPKDLPRTHVTPVAHGSQFFAVGGQIGPGCSNATTIGYQFDTLKNEWTKLPPLPKPRYAGAVAVLGGRLHYVGGADEDRSSATTDHWSLALSPQGDPIGDWQEESARLELGGHAVAATLWHPGYPNGTMYILGGGVFDFEPLDPSSGSGQCKGRIESSRRGIFALVGAQWIRRADFPVGLQHVEFCFLRLSDTRVMFLGGQHRISWLSNLVYVYDARVNEVRAVGFTPEKLYNKGGLCGLTSRRRFFHIGGVVGYHEGLGAVPGPRAVGAASFADLSDSFFL